MTSFLVYYGHDEALLPRLREADLVILESQGWSDAQLNELRDSGTTVLGYLSPFAWPDWKGPVKWWWGAKERDPQWNAWWLSLASPGWRWSAGRAARRVLERTDGLFFDNLDRLEQDAASLKPFLGLLGDLRKKVPGAIFVGNRGFANWSKMQGYLSGILFENLTDRAFSPSDRAWVRDQLMQLQGTRIYALDYETRYNSDEAAALRRDFPRIHYYRAPDEGLQSLGASN